MNMNIKYENVLIRAIEAEDIPILFHMINDGQIESMTGGWSFPVSMEQQKQWYQSIQSEKNTLRCTIDVNDLGVAGMVSFSDIDWKNRNTQIHVKILNDEKFRRKGIACLAITGMVRYAFSELNMHLVYCTILQSNLPSLKLFEKCGFAKDGQLRERVFKNGKYHDTITMSIINSRECHV